jgi:hypothetical protein
MPFSLQNCCTDIPLRSWSAIRSRQYALRSSTVLPVLRLVMPPLCNHQANFGRGVHEVHEPLTSFDSEDDVFRPSQGPARNSAILVGFGRSQWSRRLGVCATPDTAVPAVGDAVDTLTYAPAIFLPGSQSELISVLRTNEHKHGYPDLWQLHDRPAASGCTVYSRLSAALSRCRKHTIDSGQLQVNVRRQDFRSNST